ncbi:Tetratricopeptide repeat (TPR)-like superfamily protein [Zea mays]|uniref:Tetratricopeptide repeat (TPR)-like superfamily protein n=1 Tax=Zea mays TaxID=4577 RepID=A0A1D6MS92_MAIZE|nr:Tetratricopeptide repeat (TPR)-like superfamily protein [Zea mays]ONM31829.1 Tetratricopeptide repeat (TPR)-like superfamily protein [Zea mays]
MSPTLPPSSRCLGLSSPSPSYRIVLRMRCSVRVPSLSIRRDPQQREGGVPDRPHLQVRQGHRALPLQEEDQSPDVHGVVGEVPEDPEGGTAGVPAVPRAGDQVPGRTELQGHGDFTSVRLERWTQTSKFCKF